jgi:hypothetical protein
MSSDRPMSPALPADSSAPKSTRRPLHRDPPRPFLLEPRILFDGAAVDTAVDEAAASSAAARAAVHETPASLDQPPAAVNANASASPPARELAFVDASIPDAQRLIDGLRPGIEVVVVGPQEDGVAAMAMALQGRTGLEAIHLIGHGSAGQAFLGRSTLDATQLAQWDVAFAGIRNALAADGDLLLYGCDVSAGQTGLDLIGRVADRTGADVAASRDATGAQSAGGNWVLEETTGPIAAPGALLVQAQTDYAALLPTTSLTGNSGWVPVMMGVNKDPVGDSQAGAADTDIVGDATHASLYTAYDDAGTAGNTADDTLLFRLRIDNPTSSSNFGGVAIVGVDANLDGRVDLFISVDGRNNSQAVRLLDPGTGANLSPNTTSTSPLPTGWLANNGVYPFSAANYAVNAVSAATDPHWNGNTDLGADGKTDVFVSLRIPVADLAIVLAKPSPTDRSGNVGPRGPTGLAGFNPNTVIQYVSFTQTQPGPINGDLNGVGASYDKNATFTSLGTFTAPMSASEPVAAGKTLTILEPIGDGKLSASEDDSVTIAVATQGLQQSDVVLLAITDGVQTVNGSAFYDAGTGRWIASGLNLSGLNDGTLTVTASLAGASGDAANLLHDATPPAIVITSGTSAADSTPVLAGTTDLPAGTGITIVIDPDNDVATNNLLTYLAIVGVGGVWSVDTGTATPVSGSSPAGGIQPHAKITASGTDAAGNSTTATALNRPTVSVLTTNDTTPTIGGTWTNVSGDILTVTVNGTTYTTGTGLSVAGNRWTLTLPALGIGTYEVTATVTRGSTSVTDAGNNELTISAGPAVAITSGANGSDTTPTLSGTTSLADGELVIVRLDPGNDGDLSDAVTYAAVAAGGTWSVNTGSQLPVSGYFPTAGVVGNVGVLATASDVSGSASATQTLAIAVPTIGVTAIETAVAGSNASANRILGDGVLNLLEDDNVTISGTLSAPPGSTVRVLVTDANGNRATANAVVVGNNWSAAGLDLSALDNGTLTVTATIDDLELSASNTVVHDMAPPRIFILTPSIIPKSQAVIAGASDLANTGLTVTIRNNTDTATLWTGPVTTDASGNWSVTTPNGTNLVAGASGTVIIRVAPTATTADMAGNIAQTASKTGQTVQQGAANTNDTVTIGTVAGDDIVTVNEIGGGLTISGTTSLLSGVTTANYAVSVTDGTTTVNASMVSAASGAWSASLTAGQVQSLKNGQILVTATVTNPGSGISVSDVAQPSLVLASPTVTVTDDVAGLAGGNILFTFTFSEGVSGFTSGDIVVSNGTAGTFTAVNPTVYTLVVSPAAASSGTATVAVAAGVATGVATGRGNAAGAGEQPFNTVSGTGLPPTVTVDTSALATQTLPVITGTTSLAAGASIELEIDPDNDAGTANSVVYAATVGSGGTWSIATASAIPTSGSVPASGFTPYSRVAATGTDAFGYSTTAVGLNKPIASPLSTNDSTPTLTGQWTAIGGDTLTVTVNGTTYTAGDGRLSTAGNDWTLTIPGAQTLSSGTYSVTATVTRSATNANDPTANELVIDATAPAVSITSPMRTSDTTPTVSGTTDLPTGTVLTITIDPDNDGNLSNAVTYQAAVAPGGTWSVDTGSATPAAGSFPPAGLTGTIGVQATGTDTAGNASTATQSLTIDTTAPLLAITSNRRTTDTTPIISGTTDLPSGTVTVTIDPNNDGDLSDGQIYMATIQAGGIWTVEATTPLALGTVRVHASVTDDLGNVADVSQPLEIAGSAPSVTITEPIGDGDLDAAEDNAVVIQGTATGIADGSVLSVSITDGQNTIVDNATVSSGIWTLSPLNLSAMANGTLLVTATFVDPGGDSYADTASVLHDKTAGSSVSIDSVDADTGLIADFVTSDQTLLFAGSATPGASVDLVLKDAGNATVFAVTVTANGGGGWSYDYRASTLAAGSYLLSATVGVTTASQAVVVDTSAPAVPSVTAQNTGSTQPTIAGTFDATDAAGGFTVTVDGQTYALGVNPELTAAGNAWSLNLAAAGQTLIAGASYSVVATARDAAGNLSTDVTNGEITVDTTPPAAPTVDALSTTSTQPTITGTFNAADAVGGFTVSVNGQTYTLGTDAALTAAGNNWSLSLATAGQTLPIGTYEVVATARDAANNAAADASANELVITLTPDTTPPATPTVDALSTTNAQPTITGTFDAADAAGGFTVSVNGQTYTLGTDAALTAAGNNWSLSLATAAQTLPIGTYEVVATARDAANNAAADASANELVITLTPDTTPPTMPTVDALSTTNAQPTITGTFDAADAAGGFTVSVNGQTYTLGTDAALTAVSNNWSLNLATAGQSLRVGNYEVVAAARDAAGNAATDATGNELAVTQVPTEPDTTPPTLAITDDAGSVASSAITFTFTFDEAVIGFELGDVDVQGGTPSDFVAISDRSYRLTVTPPIDSVGTVTASVAANAAVDAAGNPSRAAVASRGYDTRLPAVPVEPPAPAPSAPEPEPPPASPVPQGAPPALAAPATITPAAPVGPVPVPVGIVAPGTASPSEMTSLTGSFLSGLTIGTDALNPSTARSIESLLNLDASPRPGTGDGSGRDRGLLTVATGFQIIVLKGESTQTDASGAAGADAAKPVLIVNRGIPDAAVESTGVPIEVPIPRDAFAHTRDDAVISLEVIRTDGRPLPAWLTFDPRLGMLKGTPPPGFRGEIEVRVIARDQNGNQVETVFRIRFGEGELPSGRSPEDANGKQLAARGLSDQLRAAGSGARLARHHQWLLALRDAAPDGNGNGG